MNKKQTERTLARYLRAVRRHLALPKQVKDRVIDDLRCSFDERREAGQTDEEIFASLGSARQVAAEWNEQLRAQAYRKSPWRVIPLAVAILAALALVVTAIELVFAHIAARSIGIISGADGPTAIFITSSPGGSDWGALALAAVLLGLGVAAYLRLRRLPPRE